jgi:multicomponent Na+:H+ antiporter subunit B
VNKTDILDVMSRKLAPYVFLFGFYLVGYGHLSPGGGFQGGVVIASGVILLAMSKSVATVQVHFPARKLQGVEALTFALLLAAGVFGVVAGLGFLANPLAEPGVVERVPRVGFILILNVLIGVKVGAGVSLICIHLFQEE